MKKKVDLMEGCPKKASIFKAVFDIIRRLITEKLQHVKIRTDYW